MAGIQDRVIYEDDFLGHGALSATQSDSAWLITDTSSSGSPSYTKGGINGLATIQLAATAEVENVCLSFGDDLSFDIDLCDHIEIGLAVGQAANDSTTTISWGLASARDDDPSAIVAHALFRCAGSNAILLDSDDGTTDKSSVASGASAGVAQQKYLISFAAGKSDVRFFVGGERVAAATKFDMSAYSAGLQPFIQIQKTSDTNTDSVVVDYVRVESRRA
jgi:hypothetical protein